MSSGILVGLLFVSLLLGLMMGHPLAFVLGGLSVIFGYLGWGGHCFVMFVNRIYSIMDNYVLVCIPLFVLMAKILDYSGIAEDLFDTLRYVFGKLHGGIAVAVIAVSTIFAACTGIIGASVVTMGLLGLPLMLKYGYNKRLSCGVICSGGTLGILIPPSIMLVVMGAESNVSVGKLFAGAFGPGLVLSALYMIYIAVLCKIRPDYAPAVSEEEMVGITKKHLMFKLLTSFLPTFLLILGVLGSIVTGVATATEAAGVGAALALLLMIISGQFSWKKLYAALLDTTKTASMVLTIIIAASCFAAVFIGIGGDEVVAKMLLGFGLGKWGTFAVMMSILLFLGCFIDWTAIVMLVFPIFLPIGDLLGFERLWFVLIMAVMLQDSFITPPFGYALFFLKGIAPKEISTTDIYWGVFPFWVLMKIGLVICCVFPAVITWLPSIWF